MALKHSKLFYKCGNSYKKIYFYTFLKILLQLSCKNVSSPLKCFLFFNIFSLLEGFTLRLNP